MKSRWCHLGHICLRSVDTNVTPKQITQHMLYAHAGREEDSQVQWSIADSKMLISEALKKKICATLLVTFLLITLQMLPVEAVAKGEVLQSSPGGLRLICWNDSGIVLWDNANYWGDQCWQSCFVLNYPLNHTHRANRNQPLTPKGN